MAPDSNDYDGIPLSGLSKEDKGRVVLEIARGKKIRNISLAVSLILGASLPFANNLYKDKQSARVNEAEMAKQESRVALQMSKEAIARLTDISGKLGEINAQNALLIQENDKLKTALKQLEQRSETSIKEHAKIKADVKNLRQEVEIAPDQEK